MKQKLEKILKEYIDLFCEKQGLNFDFCVQDDYLGVICFNYDLFINISDIIHDIDNNISKGLILEWYNYTLEINQFINYKTWLKVCNRAN